MAVFWLRPTYTTTWDSTTASVLFLVIAAHLAMQIDLKHAVPEGVLSGVFGCLSYAVDEPDNDRVGRSRAAPAVVVGVALIALYLLMLSLTYNTEAMQRDWFVMLVLGMEAIVSLGASYLVGFVLARPAAVSEAVPE